MPYHSCGSADRDGVYENTTIYGLVIDGMTLSFSYHNYFHMVGECCYVSSVFVSV